jgi:hypothetical protein
MAAASSRPGGDARMVAPVSLRRGRKWETALRSGSRQWRGRIFTSLCP